MWYRWKDITEHFILMSNLFQNSKEKMWKNEEEKYQLFVDRSHELYFYIIRKLKVWQFQKYIHSTGIVTSNLR